MKKLTFECVVRPMKELFYFSFSDLMIQVQYRDHANSLQYSSHRKITFGERVIIEQYLLTNVAVKTEYYNKHPAMLVYLGINSKLVKDLSLFHIKNTIKSLKDKEQNVDKTVKDLIDRSMSNYYFEQIGNTILEIRKLMREPLPGKELIHFRNKLVDLVNAYNLYAERKVSIEKVLPKELIPYIVQECKNSTD